MLRISPILKHRLAENFSFDDIVQSCNGLFLCQNFKDRKYYVCNPTTKHSFRIPPLDEPIMGMALAFDPAKSPNYHVVCVNQCRMNCDLMLQIQIYSSETSSWKMCGDPFSAHAYYGRPVYWNGSINWIDISFAYFSYFNIDRQVLRRTLAPPIHVSGSTRYTYYFGESCDHLHFIAACQYEIQFDVYEMKRDYSEWFVKYKVDLSLVIATYPEIIRDHNNRNYHYFTVLSLVRGEEEEEEPFLVLHIPRKVVRYNLVSMTSQVLHEFVGDASETKICYDVLLRLTIEDFSLDIRVVQSCNGLLLCRNIKGPGEWKYYVCNPTTKHSFRIPQLDENIKRGMGLAFDPAKSPHFHVVCVHECPKNGDLSFRIQIYSSKTGSWKICGNPFSRPLISGPAVYWNWSVHWISISSAVFMYFNIDRQVLDKMPLPGRRGSFIISGNRVITFTLS
ncbi:hypothetical protein RD792_005200 [Penstemon davidsonii]|uniref:F-box associated beta-propeller type 1 domain-containing protein n=1 Tax=Penstemon davidsonii TaxID=160366 RepID=A0ABR0DJJ4_9LAMI|nr:hypothetical protein RD792_005200 [Penstemon davidsonii]